MNFEELLQHEKPVKLYYDSPRQVDPGDYLVSIGNKTRRVNSVYLVCRVTHGKTKRFRKYILCVRCNDLRDKIVLTETTRGAAVSMEDSVCHPVFWYSRDKK